MKGEMEMKKNDYILSGFIAAICCLIVAALALTMGSFGFEVTGTVKIEGEGQASVQIGTVAEENKNTTNSVQPTTKAPEVNGDTEKPSENTEATDKNAPLTSTKEIIDKLGVDKFFFATDFPMWDSVGELERFNKIPLSEKERQMIFSENIKRLLNL